MDHCALKGTERNESEQHKRNNTEKKQQRKRRKREIKKEIKRQEYRKQNQNILYRLFCLVEIYPNCFLHSKECHTQRKTAS
jgi:hypothetical protein